MIAFVVIISLYPVWLPALLAGGTPVPSQQKEANC